MIWKIESFIIKYLGEESGHLNFFQRVMVGKGKNINFIGVWIA